MRTHFSRSAFLEGIRDMSPMLLGIVPFGIVCGVGAIAAGASPIAALAMSMIMFSGAAQIVATQLLVAGAPFAVIVLSCLVVSLRLLMYSAANASYFLGTGVLLWTVWQISTVVGILAGQIIPASWQLEFVVPLCFIAVLVPLLRDRVSLLVFAVAGVAVVALDAMPLRLSMICAGLLGIAAGMIGDRAKSAHG